MYFMNLAVPPPLSDALLSHSTAHNPPPPPNHSTIIKFVHRYSFQGKCETLLYNGGKRLKNKRPSARMPYFFKRLLYSF